MSEEVIPSKSKHEWPVSSLAEFVASISDMRPPRWVFRGQPRFSDRLLPGVQRPGVRPSGPDPVWFEKHLLDHFKRQVRPHIPHVPPEEANWEWLAIAQHHGLPTRLLDWTENSAAALYFAVENPNGDKDSGLWCYHHSGMPARLRPDPFDLPETVLYHPPHIAARFTAQRGCFTAHPPDFADREHPWPGDLCAITIEAKARVQIRRELRAMGIDRASLFPDPDGIALAIKHLYSPREDEC